MMKFKELGKERNLGAVTFEDNLEENNDFVPVNQNERLVLYFKISHNCALFAIQFI